MMNADEMVLHSSRMVQFPKMISRLMEFICKKVVNATANNLISNFNLFFRICESPQMVSMNESILLPKSESDRQNALNTYKES